MGHNGMCEGRLGVGGWPNETKDAGPLLEVELPDLSFFLPYAIFAISWLEVISGLAERCLRQCYKRTTALQISVKQYTANTRKNAKIKLKFSLLRLRHAPKKQCDIVSSGQRQWDSSCDFALEGPEDHPNRRPSHKTLDQCLGLCM